MKNIVYVSTAVKLMHENQLMDILHNSRLHNAALDISGVLLYSEGTFIQVLEGRDDLIDALYQRITTDPRHNNVIKLIDEPITEKSFAKWCMGYSSVKEEKAASLMGYLKANEKLNISGDNSPSVAAIKTFITSNKLKIDY